MRSRCATFDTSSLAGCPLPEAKTAGGAQIASSRPYTSSWTARSAGTASRTSCASAASSRSVETRMRPRVFGNALAVLADGDPIGIGPHVYRSPDRAGGYAVVVVVEAHQTGLGHRRLGGVEAVEGAAKGHQEGPLFLEHLPHRLAFDRRMRPLLGVLNVPIHQPLVDLGVGAAPRDGHEQAAADIAHLPLDLALLPPWSSPPTDARTRGSAPRFACNSTPTRSTW